MKGPSTIQLYLLRHAHAGDPTKWHGPDAARPLSDKGRLQAERLGRFLAGSGFRPDALVSSPRVRALETARLVAAPLGLTVALDEALAEGLDLESLDSLLSRLGDPGRPLLVGHDPDLSELASVLTGTPDLSIRKGALVRIDAERPIEPGCGVLRWLVPPDLLDVSD